MGFNEIWMLPKNAKKIFNPKQEKKLKEKYGAWATVHTIISCIIVFLPFIAFMFLIPENALNPTTYSGNVLGGIGGILGLIGSVSVGIGFVNIFMLLVKQYLGHLVTIISITVGLAVSAVALFVFSLAK